MAEQSLIDDFNADLEKLLATGNLETTATSEEYREMLQLAHDLATNDTRNKSRVEKTLRDRLILLANKDDASTSMLGVIQGSRLSRLWLVMAALIVLLALTVLTVPPIRVLAQEIVQRIGYLIITDAPSDAEEYVATLQSGTPLATVDSWDSEEVVSGQLTIRQASIKAGFPTYEASYIPQGYRMSSRDVHIGDNATTVDTAYRIELDPPLHDGLQMAGVISIQQVQARVGAPPQEKGVGDVPVVNVTIGDQSGVWLESIPMTPSQNEQGAWNYELWNQLVWSKDGYDFMIQTNMPADLLPLFELLKMAESLTP